MLSPNTISWSYWAILIAALALACSSTAYAQDDPEPFDWGTEDRADDNNDDEHLPGEGEGTDNGTGETGDGNADGDGDSGDGDTGGSAAGPTSDARRAQLGGPFFNRAVARSHVTAYLALSFETDVSFSQLQFTVHNEMVLPVDLPLNISIVTQWGIALGLESPAGSGRFLEVLQPLFFGGKFNFIDDEPAGLFMSGMLLFGLINDTVASEFGPNLLPAGINDFWLQFGAMVGYLFSGFDGGINAEMALQFNFGPGNNVIFSALAEFVYMFSETVDARIGFDFHTVASGMNVFAQGDFNLGVGILYARFHGYLTGSGRVFDIAFLVGFDFGYLLG